MLNILYDGSYTRAMIRTINMEIRRAIALHKCNNLHINTNKMVAMLYHTKQKGVGINESP